MEGRNSSQLEQSMVDIATELTNMIAKQYNFQANGQALKTSTDAMKTLVELKLG